MKISTQIEAILFHQAEPMSIKEIGSILHITDEEVRAGIGELKEVLAGRGIRLIEKDNEVMLATAPEMSATIEEVTKEALNKDLGKAGLETLAIILYRGPVTRADIDEIRGVNSNFILRNLLVRGLVEKVPNPGDQRSFLYRPTFELLSFLGITHVSEMPEYDTVEQRIQQFEHERAQAQKQQEEEQNETGAKEDSVETPHEHTESTDDVSEQEQETPRHDG